MDVVTFGEMMGVFNPSKMGSLDFVNEFYKSIGGAEGNVAVGLARLEKKAGFVTRVGNDPFGREITSLLKGEGVDITRVQTDQHHPTGIYFKEKRNSEITNVYYYRGNSAASQMNMNDLDEDYIKQAKWLHLTGITPLLSNSCKSLVMKSIDLAKKHNVKISFDPNIRYKIMKDVDASRKVFLEIASHVDLILPGVSEGKFMVDEEDPVAIANELLSLGAKNIVIKLGAKGAYFKNNEEEKFVEGVKVNHIVDSVGAGDGFAAGVLSALIDNLPLERAVVLGNQIGALMVMCEGDIEGFPTMEEICEFTNNSEDILR